jgi:hypothetical protein
MAMSIGTLNYSLKIGLRLNVNKYYTGCILSMHPYLIASDSIK